MTEYAATVTREGPWWIAEVNGVGATQGRTLAELHRMAVDLVVTMQDVAADEVSVTFSEVDIPGVSRRIEAMREAMRQAQAAQEQASRESRVIAREMRSMGLSVNDVAKVLKVSPQRVSQLTSTGNGEPSRRARTPSRHQV